jgi:hypothetical protein
MSKKAVETKSLGSLLKIAKNWLNILLNGKKALILHQLKD